jgi:hypothetical protein
MWPGSLINRAKVGFFINFLSPHVLEKTALRDPHCRRINVHVDGGIALKELLELGAVVIGYLVLTQWLLPKLGVPT